MAGFQMSRSQADGGTTGKLFSYNVPVGHSTLLAPGDVLTGTGTASADGTPQADAATAGSSFLGVLDSVDINYAGEALSETGLPASTAGSVKVMVDSNMLFEVDVSKNGGVESDDSKEEVFDAVEGGGDERDGEHGEEGECAVVAVPLEALGLVGGVVA